MSLYVLDTDILQLYQEDNATVANRVRGVAPTDSEQLKKLKLKVRKMDLRIAATVLEHNAILVTRNVRDFQQVPNLRIEDWSR